MTYRFAHELVDFENLPLEARRAFLMLEVEALAVLDRAWMQINPRAPRSVYKAGLRYLQDAPEREVWKNAPDVLMKRSGDCKDLVAWRLAELRESGEEDASVDVTVAEGPGRTDYHVRIRRANGEIEDPSLVLGMNRR